MKEYYYIDSANKQCGPISPIHFASHGIRPYTLVWCEGMSNWTKAGDIPELAPYLSGSPSAPPFNSYGNGNYNNGSMGNAPYGQMNNNGLPPNSNLVWAILSTLFCCLPAGIVSIVYASKVDSLWAAGQYEESRRCSRLAGQWALAAALISVALGILYMILIFSMGTSFLFI